MNFGNNSFNGIKVLAIGNVINQFLMFCGVVFLSRHYPPDSFGVYAVVLGAVNIIGLVSSCRYELTILMPKRAGSALLAFRVAILLSTSINFAILLVVAPIVIGFDLANYWFAVPICAYLWSVINIVSYYQNRNHQYLLIVLVQLSKVCLFIVFAFLFSELTLGSAGLVYGLIASLVFPGVILIYGYYRLASPVKKYQRKRLFYWIVKNSKFLKYSTPAVLVSAVASHTPVFLLTLLQGASAAGLYSMVQRIVMAPVLLLSSAINKVYMREVAKLIANRDSVYRYTKKTMMITVIPSGLISVLFALIFKYELLQIVVGESWEMIDRLALLMIPSLTFGFIAKSISGFGILGKNEVGLYYQLVLLLGIVVSLTTTLNLSKDLQFSFFVLSAVISACFIGQILSTLYFTMNIEKGFRAKNG